MYNGSTILLCVTIFVIHKQCLIKARCSIVTGRNVVTKCTGKSGKKSRIARILINELLAWELGSLFYIVTVCATANCKSGKSGKKSRIARILLNEFLAWELGEIV
jgi:hypothetical protein